MNLKSCYSHENQEAEAEVEKSMSFDKSLKELRELRSQLHQAAEYCESTFLKSKDKSDLLNNTKEYIRMTVVTVVDHLGNVSSNLEGLISQTNAFSESDLRIRSIRQRLLSCEQYAHKFAFTKMQWSENLPRFHSRYLSTPPNLERSIKEKLRDSKSQIPRKTDKKHVPEETHEDLPLFMYTYQPCPAHNLKQTSANVKGHGNIATVVPVRDGLSDLTKVPNPTFHFQNTQKAGRHRRSLHGNDILWGMRHTKRT